MLRLVLLLAFATWGTLPGRWWSIGRARRAWHITTTAPWEGLMNTPDPDPLGTLHRLTREADRRAAMRRSARRWFWFFVLISPALAYAAHLLGWWS